MFKHASKVISPKPEGNVKGNVKSVVYKCATYSMLN